MIRDQSTKNGVHDSLSNGTIRPVKSGEHISDLRNSTWASANNSKTSQYKDTEVQQYMQQIGETPLLTTSQELEVAKQIVQTRQDYRNSLLENPYIIRAVLRILENIGA